MAGIAVELVGSGIVVEGVITALAKKGVSTVGACEVVRGGITLARNIVKGFAHPCWQAKAALKSNL